MPVNAYGVYGFDPTNDRGSGGLTFNTGLVSAGADSGFANPGGSLVLSDVSVVAVPEPAAYGSVLAGICALLLAPRRRSLA
jgi:hypothetical protein